MKKFLVYYLTFLPFHTLAELGVICKSNNANAWRGSGSAIQIHSGNRYERIKFCSFPNQLNIIYEPKDLVDLSGVTSNTVDNDGITIRFGSTPIEETSDLNGSPIFTSGLPSNISLKAPNYYLQKNVNNKRSPVGDDGIFRFFSQINLWPYDCNNEPYGKGYAWIRQHWFSDFFANLRVNGRQPQLSAQGIATAEGVRLMAADYSGDIMGNLTFYEGRKTQQTNWRGFRDMCMIDVYAKFVLVPENSNNFKPSSNYNLNITWAP